MGVRGVKGGDRCNARRSEATDANGFSHTSYEWKGPSTLKHRLSASWNCHSIAQTPETPSSACRLTSLPFATRDDSIVPSASKANVHALSPDRQRNTTPPSPSGTVLLGASTPLSRNVSTALSASRMASSAGASTPSSSNCVGSSSQSLRVHAEITSHFGWRGARLARRGTAGICRIFRGFATQRGGMHRRPKWEVISA